MHFSTFELPCNSNRAGREEEEEEGRGREGEEKIELTFLWQATPAMQSVTVLADYTLQ